jgi:hypothetical protein
MTSLNFRFIISQSQTKTWAADSHTASSTTTLLAACLQSLVDPADITQSVLSSAPVICTAANQYGTLLFLLQRLYWRRFSWGKGDFYQHLVLWDGPCTQRQAQELISGPELPTRAWLLSVNRAHLRFVIGPHTGHNTLRRHLYVMGLSNNPTCRKCGIEEQTSLDILYECEALTSLRHAHLGSLFLDPEDIRKLSIGTSWNFGKGTGLH